MNRKEKIGRKVIDLLNKECKSYKEARQIMYIVIEASFNAEASK